MLNKSQKSKEPLKSNRILLQMLVEKDKKFWQIVMEIPIILIKMGLKCMSQNKFNRFKINKKFFKIKMERNILLIKMDKNNRY